MSTHFSSFVSPADCFFSVSCHFILGHKHYHSHPNAVQSQRQHKGNDRGPAFNFLLFPSWNSIILTQPSVRRSAVRLEPTWILLSFFQCLTGWGLASQESVTVNGFPPLSTMMSWMKCDLISLGIQKRDGNAWKCFLLQFTRVLMVKLSCKWAHYLDIS